MIIKKQKEARVLQTGETQSSTKMSLDIESAQVLMQMLSKNLYSDEVGSAVRECASNALDSHRRAGVTDPIVVSLRVGDTGWEFTVEDFGIGLNHKDVENIISKYGKSTKRDSENELGMMGLGFKAPLAYCSSFYFIARKDGMERKYMMYEGEDVNTIDQLYSKRTDERNGVKIIIPVRSYDEYDFRRKIKEQLCYFENVYFDVKEIDNNFTIHRSEYYQWSELCEVEEMHVCLDDVYYPIDWKKLDMERIRMPLGVRFSLTDGLYPTPNREALRYTAEAKEVIKARITDVANHFVEKYNEKAEGDGDLATLYAYYDNSDRYIDHLGEQMDITKLIKYATTQIATPQLNGLKVSKFSDLWHSKEYWIQTLKAKFQMKNGKLYNVDKSYSYGWNVGNILGVKSSRYDRKTKPTIYYYADRVGGVKKEYIRSLHNDSCWLAKIHTDERPDLNNAVVSDYTPWETVLRLKQYPKEEWDDRIEEGKYIISLITKDWIDLDALVVPQSFLDARKQNKAAKKAKKPSLSGGRRKVKGEMTCKEAVDLERYNDGRNCKFSSNIYDLKELMKSGKYFIYTLHEDFLKLDKLYKHIDHNFIKLITLSNREKTLIEKLEIHNLISYEEFMKGKNKPFKRLVTSAKIHTFIKKYEAIFSHRGKTIRNASDDLYKRLEVLWKYRNKYYRNHGYGGREQKLYEAMYAVADNHNLYDMKVYPEFLEMQKLVEKEIPWIKVMMEQFRTSCTTETGKAQVSILVDMLKYYKKRVNLDHYVKINEETEEIAETVSEETVEQSVF
jgi:anti-sigma regulatory factor (Ser/Thr protein kinase)